MRNFIYTKSQIISNFKYSRYRTTVNSLMLIGLFLLTVITELQSATTRTWTGATNTDWATASNWGGTVPSGADVINIPTVVSGNYPVITTTVSGLSGAITINSNAGAGASLTINTGGSLTTST